MGWSRFVRRKFWDEERAREIATYLEIETAENVARGMALEPARQAARRKLGNSTTIREEIYRMNSLAMLETLWQDLGYALRLLRRSPGFTLVAVLSLALGVGANTAVFSVVQAVLVRPLPYPQPDQLVLVGQQVTHGAVSISEYEFWKEHASSFATAAGYRGPGDRDLEYRGRHEWIKAMPVTADFFRTLGVGLALGREFNADETQARGPQAIVITDRLWRHVFDAGPEVIGRTVRLDDAATYIIAGVLPGGFWFPQAADAFVPLRP